MSNLKKKGRRSNQELYKAQEQIDQMIQEISNNTKISEYNFIIVTSKIQLLQKQFQMFSHISDNIVIRFVRRMIDKKLSLKMLLLFKGDQIEMCTELNHSFFQLMHITKPSSGDIEFIIQHSSVATFLKQKNLYQLMQIYNEKKNMSLFKMSSIYTIKPTYSATESAIQMIDGHQKFNIDPRIENINTKESQKEYYNVDVILTLLENLYKGANNSDSFVLKLISQQNDTQRQSKLEMCNVNDVTKIKSVTGDNFITKEDVKQDDGCDSHEIIITFNQLHYITHIYNQFTCLQVLFPKSKQDYIVIQQSIYNDNYQSDLISNQDYLAQKNQLLITTLIEGNKQIILQNSKIINSIYGTQSMKEEQNIEDDNYDDNDLEITLN